MAIWMIHPIELNALTTSKGQPVRFFPNTWAPGNIGSETIRMAFHPPMERTKMLANKTLRPSAMPLAIQPSAVDRRVTVQRSCFTVHGTEEQDFEQLLRDSLCNKYFLKFLMPRKNAASFLHELDALGISFSTVYPDFAGLAKELKLRFGPSPRVSRCAVCQQRSNGDRATGS